MGTKPIFPIIGLPVGNKGRPRADYEVSLFEALIETKGYLLVWQRASVCPCTAGIEQSTQADPNCFLCKGTGWVYFGSDTPQDLSSYTFDALQQSIIDSTQGMIIRGVISGITNKQDVLDKTSNWVDGRMNLTVRAENKLGFLDKVIALDCAIAYTQIFLTSGNAVQAVRYPIIGVNRLATKEQVFIADTDFNITDDGKINWLIDPIPEVDTRMSIHYLCHPTWLVVDHPHTARITSLLLKIPVPNTPTGNAIDLPTQATVMYDFLV